MSASRVDVVNTVVAEGVHPGAAACMMDVLKPGLLSTIQDRGRYGHQRLGVPVNGAMDEWSHRIANILVGNQEDAATLECTVSGPSVRFDADVLLAVTGAGVQVNIDGIAAPLARALVVRKGATLGIGKCLKGARAYLAVRGGFAVETVLNSHSTFIRGAFGGFEGRALRKDDRVAIGSADIGYPVLHATLLKSGASCVEGPKLPVDSNDAMLNALRFIPGPQWHRFTDAARIHFNEGSFRIDARSDRMGYRLSGPKLDLSAPLEMISEPVNFGTVQVPPDGQPIVLMADRQGAGGYPKIGYVISADLPALAQAMPGEEVGFEEISIDTAEQAYLDKEDALSALQLATRMTLRDAAAG
jgi:biotin-dependent carboxylase-like uncharacterized protein